jgi:hypothetical protein
MSRKYAGFPSDPTPSGSRVRSCNTVPAKRIDLARIVARGVHGIAQRSEIRAHRHARRIRQHHAHRMQRDTALGVRMIDPGRKRCKIVARHHVTVFMPQQILQQHAQRHRQAPDTGTECALGGCKVEIRYARPSTTRDWPVFSVSML